MSQIGTVPSARRVGLIGAGVVARVTNRHDELELQVGGHNLAPGAAETFRGPQDAIGLGGDIPVTIESAPIAPVGVDELNPIADTGDPEPPEPERVGEINPPEKPKPKPKRKAAAKRPAAKRSTPKKRSR